MKRKKLSNKDLNKFAEINGVDLNILLSLNELGALDITSIHAGLIKHEYKKLSNDPQYTGKQIKEALAKEYDLSMYHIETIIYDKRKDTHFCCKECGEEMSRYKFSKNKGRCDKCAVKHIEHLL